MADEAHLEIIRYGVLTWNHWRDENPSIRPQLQRAKLSEANLSGAKLSEANLEGATLRCIDLTRANLSRSDLRGAYLGGANLNGADLRSAYLRRVNLDGAKLSRADLCGADLGNATLDGADLDDANLVAVDLRGAKLSGSRLNGADIVEANLRGADLRAADFRGAKLRRADLRSANLQRAKLGKADLGEADLSGADLSGADLSKADLYKTNFSGATLNEAQLEGAVIGWAVFATNDLSAVEGLDAVKHSAPSSVGVDTLSRSKGQIPGAFLRGCGLNDWQIAAAQLYRADLPNGELDDILYRIHDLKAQQPIQISPLFISYSHVDGAFVDRLELYLTRSGIRFWRDVHHAAAGRLERQVDRAIRLNPTVLIILSEGAVKSDWVEHEVRLARRLEKETGRDVLCPVALDGSWKECRWPERLREQVMEYNILDFSKWQEASNFDRMYRRLIEGLGLFYRKEGGET